MTDEQKIKKLSHAFEEVIWMAIRYAHGRHSFAPSIVRDAIFKYQEVFPDWKPSKDTTIEAPQHELTEGFDLPSDYLHDLFEDNNND